MAGEEPPFLSVGTDVSAKYKGAFCEAKIKKVIRSVKCKVIFKNNLGTVVVPDDHVKGTLRVGAHIEAKHPEKNQFLEAIINKLHDHSQYTVVFDDGDETTLRRTSLCLKSGRHFAESETLDQLPLTHPEHFGTPVMGSKGRKRRSLTRSCINDDGSSDDERISKKKDSKMKEPDPDIGKVVCVELGEKKKQKDNWFPALVVSPSAQDSIRINAKEEYLVRSFKDGRYYTVTKKDARDFTREIGSKVDNNTLKTAVEKALMYTDRDELPPHWDRELLFGMDESTDEDSASDSDSDSSDDEPSEEKDRFVAQLYKFMDDRGTPINKAPAVGNRDLNLYKLFKVVQKLGGYNRVTNHMQWKTVYTKMGLPSYNTSSSHQIKQAYKKYLHSFEDFYRKLGCTMGTSTRSGRMRHRSGRNIIMTRDRDREFKAAGRRSSKQDNKEKKKDDSKLKNKDEDKDKTKNEDNKDKADVKKNKHDSSREVKSKGDGGKELTHDKDDLSVEEEKEKEKSKPKEEKKHKSKDDHKKEKISEKKQKTDKEPKGNKNKSDDTDTNVDIKKEKREQSCEVDVVHSKEIKDEKPLLDKIEKDTPEKVSTKAAKLEKASKNKTEKDGKDLKFEKEAKSEKSKPDKESKNEKKEKIGKDAKEGKMEKSEKIKSEKDKEHKSEKVKSEKGSKEGKTDKSEKVKHMKESKSKLDKEDKHSPEKETVNKEERIKVEKDLKIKIENEDKDENKKLKEEKIKSKSSRDDDSKIKGSPSALKRGRKKSGKDDSHGDGKEDTTDEGDNWTEDIDIGVGDKVRVKYGRGRQQKIYEAKVLELEEEDGEKHFYVHYTGWNMRYDEWVKRPRIVENLSQKARKGRSAGSPKMLSLKGLPSKRGRPSLSKSPMHLPLSKKHSSAGQPTRPRSTRSDRNSLVDSPFVNGLEPRKRIRKSSGMADHSTDNLKDSDDDESVSECSDSDAELSMDSNKEMEQELNKDMEDDKSLLIPELRNECDDPNLGSDNEDIGSKTEEEVESKVRKKGRKSKEKSPSKNDDETMDDSINENIKKEKDKSKISKKSSLKNKGTDDDTKTRSKSKLLKKNKGKSVDITDDEESTYLDETPTRTRNKKSKQREMDDNSDEKESEKDHDKQEEDDERCEIDETEKKKKKSKRLSRSKMHDSNDDKKDSDSFQGTPPKTKLKGRKKIKKLKEIDLDESKLDITESEIEADDEKEDNKDLSSITIDEKMSFDLKSSDEVEDLQLSFDKTEESNEISPKIEIEAEPSEVPKEDEEIKVDAKQSENEEENIKTPPIEILDENKDYFFTSSPKLEVEDELPPPTLPISNEDVKCNLDFFKEPPEPEPIPIPKPKRKEELISDEEQNEVIEEKPKIKSEKRKKSKLEKMEDDTDESEAEGRSKKSKKKGRSKREKESDDESTELSELENEVKKSKQKMPKSLRSKKSKLEDETPLSELSNMSEPSPQKASDSCPVLEIAAEITEKQPELTELEPEPELKEDTEDALDLEEPNLVISEVIPEIDVAEAKVAVDEVKEETVAEILPVPLKVENIIETSPEPLKLCEEFVESKDEIEIPIIDNVKASSDTDTAKSDDSFKIDKIGSLIVDLEIKEEPVHKEGKKEKKSKMNKSVKKEDGSDIDGELRSEEDYKKKKIKDEEKKNKEGKQKKSKDKKGKSKKDDGGDKECKDLDKKSDKIKKKENKKKKDAEKLKKQEKEEKDSDMESIECMEFVKKKEKKNKKNKTDKSKDDEPEKKKSKKKSGKEPKSDKDGNEDDKEFKENKKLSKKNDSTSKSLKKEKKKEKNKRESSSSDDHDALKYKGEKDHNKKAEKKLKLESVKEKNIFPKQQENPDFMDSDDANLLFCKEDVPISPIAGDALPSKIEFNLPAVEHNEPVCSSPASYLIPSSSHSLPTLNDCSHTLQAFLKHEPESSTVLDNTPPTTPESALSTLSESPIRDRENNSLLCDEESTKSGQESVNEIDMDSFNEVRKHVCHENIDFAQSEAAMVLGSMGVQGFEKRLQLPASPTNKRPKADVEESSPIKKRKKSNRRSHNLSDSHKSGSSLSRQRHSSSKSNKGPGSQLLVFGELIQHYHLKMTQSPSDGSPDMPRICSALHENQGSDSDEASPHDRIPSHNLMGGSQPSICSSSNSSSSSSICDKEVTVYTATPRSPRPSKFNFFVELDEYSDGAERIAVLQEKLAELRKTYMALKAEVACIDRRRKKLKRKEKEAAAASSTAEVECS